jgi:transcriptional regulator with XRE-family HTH domain
VKKAREDKGWSQERLASLSGVAQPTISGIENGAAGTSIRTIQKLAGALEVKVSTLVDEEASEAQPPASVHPSNFDAGAFSELADQAD